MVTSISVRFSPAPPSVVRPQPWTVPLIYPHGYNPGGIPVTCPLKGKVNTGQYLATFTLLIRASDHNMNHKSEKYYFSFPCHVCSDKNASRLTSSTDELPTTNQFLLWITEWVRPLHCTVRLVRFTAHRASSQLYKISRMMISFQVLQTCLHNWFSI